MTDSTPLIVESFALKQKREMITQNGFIVAIFALLSISCKDSNTQTTDYPYIAEPAVLRLAKPGRLAFRPISAATNVKRITTITTTI